MGNIKSKTNLNLYPNYYILALDKFIEKLRNNL